MKIRKLIHVIQKWNYSPKYSKWIFVFSLLFISIFIYNYHVIIFKPPQSIHRWRQCDCLSITMNYYQDNNLFFEPSVHYLGKDGTGKTVSDFPIIYYIVAQLWKVFGHYEFIYRLIILLFFFSGLFALFKIFENVLHDSLLAIAGSLLLFTSPTLVYYANNFLMDIPAFSLAIIGLYFFIKFSQSSKNKHLYLFSVFYIIAGLLKVSSLLSFFAILGLFVLELFNVQIVPGRKIFQYPNKQIVPLIAVLIIPMIWYMYASNYNFRYNGGIFLIGTLPIWDVSLFQIKVILRAINDHIGWDYFRKETQIVFVLMFVFTLVFYKKSNKLYSFLTVFLVIGFLMFTLLFFQAFKDHDYYTINLFIVVPVVLLSFMLICKNRFNMVYRSLLFRIIIIVFLIHNIDFARRRIDGRYNPNGWQNKDYIEYIQAFGEISPYMRSIGIKKEDKVLSLSDNSINISLYLMNQKGWTNYGINAEGEKIENTIKMGAKYLLIFDKEVNEKQAMKSFIKGKIGEYKNIDIYVLCKKTP